jgi:hypothetical protein
MFLPWSRRRVEGSFWIRFDTAAHAHLRSAPSGASIYPQRISSYKKQRTRSAYLLYDRQDRLVLRRGRGRGGEACREVVVRHAHGIVPALRPLLLRLAHGEDVSDGSWSATKAESRKTFALGAYYRMCTLGPTGTKSGDKLHVELRVVAVSRRSTSQSIVHHVRAVISIIAC